ncbi:hypothetical protein Ancab_000819 [Ancistrocladus abbreviatus]
MACLQNEGRLLRGEHNLLGEAFLIIASAAGVQQQQEVLRSGIKRGIVQSCATASPLLHPMSSHLSWMLSPLLNLLRAIHSLWSPAGDSSLTWRGESCNVHE